MRRKLAAGNWKMHGLSADLSQLTQLVQTHPDPAVDILICPPATLLSRAAEATAQSPIAIGAQDCHSADKGAHTGDLAAAMLKDAGATHVILGHSERRSDHGEDNEIVHSKAQTAAAAGLTTIICIGESLAERDAGITLDTLTAQMTGSIPADIDPDLLVVAYEPIWAIGTGLTPTTDQIAEAHAHMRAKLAQHIGSAAKQIRLLYGGSVKPANAAEIFAVPDVDGALVGGASLKADDFSPIITALGAS